MSQWGARTPAEYWKLETKGYSERDCIAFDNLVLTFWSWFENKREEQEIVKEPKKQPKKGETWGRRYPSDQSILALWNAKRPASSSPNRDPEAASLTDDDILSFIDEAVAIGEQLT